MIHVFFVELAVERAKVAQTPGRARVKKLFILTCF